MKFVLVGWTDGKEFSPEGAFWMAVANNQKPGYNEYWVEEHPLTFKKYAGDVKPQKIIQAILAFEDAVGGAEASIEQILERVFTIGYNAGKKAGSKSKLKQNKPKKK